MTRVKREKEQEEEEVKKRVKVEADVKIEYEEAGGEAPENWRAVYERVKKMRAEITAPVDTMGCERLPESVSKKITPKVHRFQLLISLLMSSQTKDEVNAIAMKNLQTELPGGLTVQSVLDTPQAELDRLIYKVGFHRRKSQYMKEVAKVLREKYDDDTPETLKEVMALQGIGPKMAHLFMHRAWQQVVGIGVDVHVHRLANLWKWVKTTNPEDTRKQLEEWLPKVLWVDINPMLVGFGQAICKPRYPRCDLCTLSGTGLCPGDKGKNDQK